VGIGRYWVIDRLKPKSEFSRNVLTLMTGTTIAQAIPIAISPILTRIYTPEDFGVFALFIAFTGIFSSIASGRYELAIMLPKKDEEAINIFALSFILITSLSLLLLVLVVLFNSYFTKLFNNEDISFWLYLIPISLFLTGVFNILSYFNNRQKNYKDIANATIIKSIILAIVQLSMGFVISGVSGLISGQIVSSMFANIRLLKNIIKDKLLVYKVSKVKIIALAKRYKDFPKYQAPHAMLNIFSSNIPIYLFTPFFGVTTVGLYSLSTRIVFAPMMILAGASAKVYNQKVTQLYNKNGDAYSFTIRLLKSLFKKIIIPFLIIVIFAPDIFAFVFGESWREAGIYTQILSPWLLLNILVSSISFIPSLIHMQKKALFISIVQVIVSIIFIFIGILQNDVYLTLSLYMISYVIILIYNFSWMLKKLKDINF
jgi:O-antigen/teichoic acid export membrane protein